MYRSLKLFIAFGYPRSISGLSLLFTSLKVNDVWYGSDFYYMSLILLVSVYADSQSFVTKKISEKVEGQLSKSQNFFCASMLAFSHHLFDKCKCKGTGAILIKIYTLLLKLNYMFQANNFQWLIMTAGKSLWALTYFRLDSLEFHRDSNFVVFLTHGFV